MKTINLAVALILLCAALQASPVKSKVLADKTVTFEVALDTAIKFSPFVLVYANSLYDGDARTSNPKMIEPVKTKNGSYLFKLPAQSKPHYFSVCWYNGKRDVCGIQQYLFEPGDHIKMLLRPGKFNGDCDGDFTGPGSAKYRCKNDLFTAVLMEMDKMKADTADHDETDEFKRNIRLIDAQMYLVEKYQPEMSDYAYYMLKTGIVCKQFSTLQIFPNSNPMDFIRMNAWLPNLLVAIPEPILIDSKDYLQFKLLNIKVPYKNKAGKVDFTGYFNQIKRIPNQLLRDRLLTIFFIRNSLWINTGYEELLNDALAIVKDRECKDILATFKRSYPGDQAYNFSLTDVNGDTVTLDQFKGKTVFIDFWFTGCVHCENYYKTTLAAIEKKYELNKDVVFITVCIDKAKDKWLNSVAGGTYTSAKAVNLYTNGEGENNKLIQFYNIRSYPRPMLIDRYGKIIKFTGSELRSGAILIAEIEKALVK